MPHRRQPTKRRTLPRKRPRTLPRPRPTPPALTRSSTTRTVCPSSSRRYPSSSNNSSSSSSNSTSRTMTSTVEKLKSRRITLGRKRVGESAITRRKREDPNRHLCFNRMLCCTQDCAA
uniref:(northern house mosquito) hypothetical protein n=1 Tax=Culex pipiens TaxID=7175 RepID=A0A8D8FWF9_CULPI